MRRWMGLRRVYVKPHPWTQKPSREWVGGAKRSSKQSIGGGVLRCSLSQCTSRFFTSVSGEQLELSMCRSGFRNRVNFSPSQIMSLTDETRTGWWDRVNVFSEVLL